MKKNINMLILGLILFSFSFIYLISVNNNIKNNNDKVEVNLNNDNINDILALYVDNVKNNTLDETVDYILSSYDCTNNEKVTWDNTTHKIKIDKITKTTGCRLNFKTATTYDFKYTAGSQTFTVPKTGKYKIEAWGAQGGSLDIYNNNRNGGKGSYTSGEITLTSGENLYIYVGGKGIDVFEPGTIVGLDNKSIGATISGSFNGGGAGTDESDGTTLSGNETGAPGGGATDIRLVSGQWNNAASLNSRIMVAAGGSGAYNINGVATPGNSGGGINSEHYLDTLIATQTAGYQFGVGMDSAYLTSAGSTPNCGDIGPTGAGGGYYGGYRSTSLNWCSENEHYYTYPIAAGGSSYISGHTGCVAIASSTDTANPRTPKSGCTSGTTTNSCSVHYSNKTFTNTVMIDGNGYSWTNVKGSLKAMPNPIKGNYNEGEGHYGYGYVRITYLGN